MGNAGRVPARAFAALALVIGFAAAAAPASADIKINEIESQPTDWVELTNTGAAAVDIGDYVLRDSGPANPTTIPAGTMLQPGAFFSIDSNAGLGNPDGVRLFDAGGTMIDSYAYDDHAGQTYGRCPDGTGAFVNTEAPTRGAANACPPTGIAWPGGSRDLDPRRRRDVRRERQRAGLPAVRHGRAGRAVGRAQLQRVVALPHGQERDAVVAGRTRLHHALALQERARRP